MEFNEKEGGRRYNTEDYPAGVILVLKARKDGADIYTPGVSAAVIRRAAFLAGRCRGI